MTNHYQVKTFNQIALRGLQDFDPAKFEVGHSVTEPHAVLCRSHRLEPSQIPSSVLAVARAGAGVNNIPVDACSERGIVVFNTPGANANSVKELVIAGLLMSCRHVIESVQWVRGLSRKLELGEMHAVVEAEKDQFAGHELRGRTLGVVGLGSVGAAVARAALDLGMELLGFDPVLSVDSAWHVPSKVRRVNSLAVLFARSDFVSLHLPLNEQTSELVDAGLLAVSKPGLNLLNFARAEIVDHLALARALDSGKIARYISDFPHPALIGHDEVFAMPHLGASTVEATENCAKMAVHQLVNFLQEGNTVNSVNFPSVSLESNDGFRIAVSNFNEAGTLGALLSILANQEINVLDMINKSRGNLAYNLIDVDIEPEKTLLEEIVGVPQVIGVRYLGPRSGVL